MCDVRLVYANTWQLAWNSPLLRKHFLSCIFHVSSDKNICYTFLHSLISHYRDENMFTHKYTSAFILKGANRNESTAKQKVKTEVHFAFCFIFYTIQHFHLHFWACLRLMSIWSYMYSTRMWPAGGDVNLAVKIMCRNTELLYRISKTVRVYTSLAFYSIVTHVTHYNMTS